MADQLSEFYSHITSHGYKGIVFESIKRTEICLKTSNPYLCAMYRFARTDSEERVSEFKGYNVTSCSLVADVMDKDIVFEEIISSFLSNLNKSWNLLKYYPLDGTKYVDVSDELSDYYNTPTMKNAK